MKWSDPKEGYLSTLLDLAVFYEDYSITPYPKGLTLLLFSRTGDLGSIGVIAIFSLNPLSYSDSEKSLGIVLS